MKAHMIRNVITVWVTAASLIGLSVQECFADPVCVSNGGNTKRVCVEWSKQSDPVPNTHFSVDYTCQGCSEAAAVELMTGDLEWVVWSEVISTGAPANIGALTTTDADNYGVKIAKGTGDGAANVGSVALTPDGAQYYSSIAPGSRISGDLTGDLTVQKSSGGSGGSASFRIAGDAEADITIPVVSSLIISGDLTSTGSINVTDKIDGGELRVKGDVALNSTITIADIEGAGVQVEFNKNGQPGELEFAGHLTLGNGVGADHQVEIDGEFTGSVDLNGGPVAGHLVLQGGGSGKIFNGGAVTGTVELPVHTFSGEATFASVAGGAYIKACFANINGTIHITGDMNGQIMTTGYGAQQGNLLADGKIQIDGDMGGSVTVQVDALGKILVNGNISGNVLVGRHVGVDGEIVANADGTGGGDITGDVTVTVEFNGNICGDNLDPEEDLPQNIDITYFGPDWTICGQHGCICNWPTCAPFDCNENQIHDFCDISYGTSQDCDWEGTPDECQEGEQLAIILGRTPENNGTLWRTEKNIARLTFACDVEQPEAGDLEIRELLDEGEFGDDLSASFTITVENTASGWPRILKIHNESEETLDHRTWYGILHTGDWDGVDNFTVHYLVQVGDADGNRFVNTMDVGLVNGGVPTFGALDDDRRDIDGDGNILFNDVSLANGHQGGYVSKPSGH